MLYRVLKRMIQKGNTDNIQAKLDIFYAAGKITEAEYKELTSLMEETEVML